MGFELKANLFPVFTNGLAFIVLADGKIDNVPDQVDITISNSVADALLFWIRLFVKVYQ